MKKYTSIAAGAAIATFAAYNVDNSSNFAADPDHKKFVDFLSKHSKSYGTDAEFQFRFQNFKNSLAAIKNNKGGATLGLTKFADWSKDEYKALLGLDPKWRDDKEGQNKKRRL